MTDMSHKTDTTHSEAEAGPNLNTYLGIFAVLSVCTLMSFLVNHFLGQNHTSMGIIMLISVVKAVCVAMIFMHLKFDWSRVYFLIVPVMILGVMMMLVLLPDIVLGWHIFGE
jgi:caa(3)-type oxidase subunit IV